MLFRTFSKRLWAYLNIMAYLGAAVLAVTAVFIKLAPYAWYFDLFSNYLIQWCAAAVLWTIVCIAWRNARLGFALALLTGYLALPLLAHTEFSSVAYSHENVNTASLHTFSVMQTNVNHHNEEYGTLIAEIQRAAPTVITVNEVTARWREELTTALGEQYPYQAHSMTDDYRGMTVFSSIPLVRHEVYSFSEADSPVIEAELSNGVTLFAVHSLSPVSVDWAEGRNEFIKKLADRVAASKGRVIVSGDLNTTEYSPHFRPLVSVAQLSNAREGFGWKPSWLRGMPLTVAIDHILYKGEGMEVMDFNVMNAIGSDHWPVMATFRWDEQNN